ncbi:DUF4214 domain-containing protein [Massilia arenae]|uniref:DUF4214 domain-containing protein n=1 Tax=Massilia arenae TaxID=2603288 RepID=A0A5C7FQ62_9BURK|nr:DUF4214 domain-containing protein [Massilia arenae]TXF97922.1 DUF4214 domain-containing protein [Massilia arenae]
MAIVATRVAAVQELYVAYFGRPADTAGLDYWTNVVEANKGAIAAVSAAFAAEKEYTDLFKGMTNAQIVDKIYSNMFGRGTSSTDGREYWVNLLNDKKVTVDVIVAEVAGGALTTDAEAIENKVAAATAFTAELNTTAENTGYNGPAALAAAKAFIAGITTDASLSAAIAPSALAATVAKVVEAGTPFTLEAGLSNLVAAQDAVVDFLAGIDLDNNANTKTTAVQLTTALNGTETAGVWTGGAVTPVDAIISGFRAANPVVRDALIQDRSETLATALETAQANREKALVAAETAAPGLSDAIASLAVVTESKTAAANAVTLARASQANAEVAYEVASNSTITIATNGAVTGLINVNAAGTASLAPGVTEATNPGVTALLTAVRATNTAVAQDGVAADAVYAAKLEVHLLDAATAENTALSAVTALLVPAQVGEIVGRPTAAQILTQQANLEVAAAAETANGGTAGAATTALTNFNNALKAFTDLDVTANNPLTNAVTIQDNLITSYEGQIKALDAAVAGYEVAADRVAELTTLNNAVTAARETFVANDFKLPVTLGASAVATTGSDIFVLGEALTTTIASFGRAGTDALYIGSDFTLNTGALSTGDNTKLEVFFIANATGVRIHVETEVYGSDSTSVPEQVITLTGVAAADLQFDNGIITLKGTTV